MSLASREHVRASLPVAMAQAPLPMLDPGRRCGECGSPLSRYNAGPSCNACKRTTRDKRIARITGPVATHEQRMKRVLAHLESGAFSSPQLADLMGCDLFDVQEAVAALVLTNRVERASSATKWRGWRLAAGFPDAGEG